MDKEKKVMIIGVVGMSGVGSAQIKGAIAALEEAENCTVELVNLAESEKSDLRALATDLVSMRDAEVRQMRNMEPTCLNPEPLQDAGKSLRNYEKENSQQGWKGKNKYRR